MHNGIRDGRRSRDERRLGEPPCSNRIRHRIHRIETARVDLGNVGHRRQLVVVQVCVERKTKPLIDDARATMAHLRGVLSDLRDPKNKSVASKLLYDKDGDMAENLDQTIAKLESVMDKIDRGEGSLGKLVNDSKPHDDLNRFFDNLNRNKTLKRLIRFVIKADEKMDENAPPD